MQTTETATPTPEMEHAIRENLDLVQRLLPDVAGMPLDYGEASIEWMDGYIDRVSPELSGEPGGLVGTLGAYLGESIRRRYGGRWVSTDSGVGVEINPGFIVFPFSKVEKQFVNGPEDSILSFYQVIPAVMAQQASPAE
ncbi:MAG: hypothetical protein ACOY82_13415 [Pseudomonadota bacterium]